MNPDYRLESLREYKRLLRETIKNANNQQIYRLLYYLGAVSDGKIQYSQPKEEPLIKDPKTAAGKLSKKILSSMTLDELDEYASTLIEGFGEQYNEAYEMAQELLLQAERWKGNLNLN